MPDAARAFTVVGADGVVLSGEESGGAAGADAVVLLHGLTASRRYVVMGSTVLQRAGHRVISYDARGHGRSAPAARADEYGYERLADDLETVLDERGVQRALLAGASMGAHTALRFALSHPERVKALAIITPAFDPTPNPFARAAELERWDALARGLREGGVDGFVAAYELDAAPAALRATLETVLRQRLAAHEHPLAVADALEAVPRSRPFDTVAQLHAIDAPTIVVASRDEADPGHPLAVGERYAQAIPQAQLLVEDEGPPTHSPLAWQGGQLSRAIDALAARARV
ncbi:MAG TPA: alpha/beta hydrolase [Solirubrobacteraceae bacterium]|jgi:pimeloyl-ACP methyl ester carboxylesterase|nr:alpha/beta hydrolase [Solirubrobacteraceae bacterium]